MDLSQEISELKNTESYYKWFLEVQVKLSEDLSSRKELQDDYIFNKEEEESDSDEDSEEETLDRKRRLERVKKYLGVFSDSDVLLELVEDERTKSDFVLKFYPIEAFSVLGSISFFNTYLKQETSASQSLVEAKKFVEKFKATESNSGGYYVSAMEKVLNGLDSFYSLIFDKEIIKNKQDSGDNINDETLAAILGIQNYFIAGFCNDELLGMRKTLADKLVQIDSKNPEWNLNRYYVKRSSRLYNSKNNIILPSEDEKLDLETVFKNNSKNPCHILATCQYLTDVLAGNGPNEVIFAEKKFSKHTDVVNFITEKAEEISKQYTSFLRAYSKFAEIFATELPITRQDRKFARSLLERALNANPTSSKINHKFGLFLIKGRLFNEGRTYLQKAVELDPKNASAHYNLVKILLKDPNGSKSLLESFFGQEFSTKNDRLGPENQLPFWKGCYYFVTGDKEIAVGLWVDIILEFYVSKPELELELVLPFQELPDAAESFFWQSSLTLENIEPVVKDAYSKERTRRRVVLVRLLDLVKEAIEINSEL